MPQPLIILGVSGNAYDILDTIDAINNHAETWRPTGFLDDFLPAGSLHAGLPILAKLADAVKFTDQQFISAIGSERSYRLRPDIIAATRLHADRFVTLVHPLAQVSTRSKLGRGICVNAGAYVAGSAVLGDHVWVGPGTIVGHDAIIGDHTILAPATVISGFVNIEAACYIGAAAAVRQRVRIKRGALVGMGSVVTRDVEEGVVVVGNPARALPVTQDPAAQLKGS
jgi:sugar O-acyltransferase (sialic acid O-acetyltransferase NeuD family)